ncbi:MAG: hypothetical protein P4L10_13080 [Acidobacteriaceae bacterium]|nr:hypothetical protein [Acidobacteriaceae bacterium]
MAQACQKVRESGQELAEKQRAAQADLSYYKLAAADLMKKLRETDEGYYKVQRGNPFNPGPGIC